LLSTLDESAIRVNNDPAELTRQQLEDIEDLREAKKAMAEYRRTGLSYTVDELREEFGLL